MLTAVVEETKIIAPSKPVLSKTLYELKSVAPDVVENLSRNLSNSSITMKIKMISKALHYK